MEHNSENSTSHGVRPLGNPAEVELNNEMQISRARLIVREMADGLGMSKVQVHELVTCVSELAYNVFFHADGKGKMICQPVYGRHGEGVEVIVVDRGPGINDIALAMQEGYSTRGGMGGGLPGVERLSDEMEIDSKVGIGTRIMIRKWK